MFFWTERKINFFSSILSCHDRRSYFWILFWHFFFPCLCFEACWYFFSLLKEMVGKKWFKNLLPDRCLTSEDLLWQFTALEDNALIVISHKNPHLQVEPGLVFTLKLWGMFLLYRIMCICELSQTSWSRTLTKKKRGTKDFFSQIASLKERQSCSK